MCNLDEVQFRFLCTMLAYRKGSRGAIKPYIAILPSSVNSYEITLNYCKESWYCTWCIDQSLIFCSILMRESDPSLIIQLPRAANIFWNAMWQPFYSVVSSTIWHPCIIQSVHGLHFKSKLVHRYNSSRILENVDKLVSEVLSVAVDVLKWCLQ